MPLVLQTEGAECGLACVSMVATYFGYAPHRDAADTRAIAEYNERLNAHPQLVTATVPLRDGVAISVKR